MHNLCDEGSGALIAYCWMVWHLRVQEFVAPSTINALTCVVYNIGFWDHTSAPNNPQGTRLKNGLVVIVGHNMGIVVAKKDLAHIIKNFQEGASKMTLAIKNICVIKNSGH